MSSYLSARELCSTGRYANVAYVYPRLQCNNQSIENFIVDINHRECKGDKCYLGNKEANSKLFIRNPKTASEAVRLMASKNKLGNLIVQNHHNTTNNDNNEVVVIRDPVERFISAVNFMRSIRHRYNTAHLLEFDTFVNMMKVTDFDTLYDKVLKRDVVFTPQFNWVGENSTVLCYEKGLEKEFKDKLDIDAEFVKINTKESVNGKNWITVSDEEREKYWKDSEELVKNIVNHFYKRDIELYNKHCN